MNNLLKILVSTALLACIGNLFSQQIFNGGFEETNEFNSETFWQIYSVAGCSDPPFPVTGLITNDANTGTNAVYLTPDYCFPTGHLLPGALHTHITGNPYWGYEYNYRPEILNFYYKYSPAISGETAFVKIMLFNYDPSTYQVTEIIAESYASIVDVETEYRLFSLSIEYFSPNTPSYIHIMFSTSEDFSYINGEPWPNLPANDVNTPGSFLLIDDVWVSGGNIGIDEEVIVGEIDIYPNPVISTLFVENMGGNEIESITIVNVLGNIVKKQGNNSIEFNVTDLEQGVYFVQIETENSRTTKRIIKN